MNKFLVLIGPQASGKSVLAKLIYFLKDGCFSTLSESIQEGNTYTQYTKKLKNRFLEIFPDYTWKNQTFAIDFKCGEKFIQIANSKINSRYKLEFNISKDFSFFYNTVKTTYTKLYEEGQNQKATGKSAGRFVHPVEVLHRAMKQTFEARSGEENIFENGLFIPAGRSFFANLKQNVFSFLSKNIEIDPFLKEFGAAYESARNIYSYRSNFLKNDTTKVDELINEILCGKYSNTKDDDWIETPNRKVRLINSSSGQQESLPMLLVLSFFPFVQNMSSSSTFFIEEPEAHLFPHAQKKIMELIGLTYNLCSRRNNFVITTHSPYILSALNNLIAAEYAISLKRETPAIKRLSNYLVPFSDISAYSVNGGIYKSIKDEKERLIDASYIDTVSQEFEQEIDEILGAIYGK